MSFILKALQKLEEENAARPAEPAAIESAILAPSARPASTPRRTLTWLAIVLVFLAGGAMTYLLMPRAATSVAPRQTPAVTQAVPATPVLPATPVTATVPFTPTETSSAKPASVAPTNPRQAASGNGRQPSRRGSRARNVGGNAPVDDGTVAPSPPATAVEASAAQLTVNGIAFQDDPGASGAVVNGVYVKRGMTVGGARVERIFQDKVRFSRNGATFEVSLTK